MLPGFRRITRTLFLRAVNRSDYERWRNPFSLEGWWETRTQKVAAFIPKGTRVIEFGRASGGSSRTSIQAAPISPRTWSTEALGRFCAMLRSHFLLDRGFAIQIEQTGGTGSQYLDGRQGLIRLPLDWVINKLE
jgi:hypothetical protein